MVSGVWERAELRRRCSRPGHAGKILTPRCGRGAKASGSKRSVKTDRLLKKITRSSVLRPLVMSIAVNAAPSATRAICAGSSRRWQRNHSLKCTRANGTEKRAPPLSAKCSVTDTGGVPGSAA